MTNLSLEIIKMSARLPLSDTHSVSGLGVYIIGRPVMVSRVPFDIVGDSIK